VSIGIVTLIMGATAVFGELQSALNQIWDVKAKPDRGVIMSFIVDRLRSFSIAICVGFLLLVSLVISAVISGLQNYMNNWLPGFRGFGKWQTLSPRFSCRGSFAMIYKFLPDVVISWRDVWIGAAVTALLFTGRKIRYRYLPRKNCDGQCVWSGRLAGCPAVLGLLLCADQLFGSGVHAGLRAPVWPRHPPQKHAVRVGRKSDSI
jgi:Predicted membrane protein